MLGADVVMAEAQRLAERQLQNLLRARRERDLAGGDFLPGSDDPHNLGTNAVDRDLQRLKHACGQALLLAEQPQQNVLGPDVIVLERPGFFLRQHHNLAGSLCKSLEHMLSLGWRDSYLSVGELSKTTAFLRLSMLEDASALPPTSMPDQQMQT